MAEFKIADDLEEEAIALIRAMFKALQLDIADTRTELLFSKKTKATVANHLLDVYKQGWDDRSTIL